MSASTITWTLFGAKLEEILDIDTSQNQEKFEDNLEIMRASDEYGYSVSDLVAEVFYITSLKLIDEECEEWEKEHKKEELLKYYTELHMFINSSKKNILDLQDLYSILINKEFENKEFYDELEAAVIAHQKKIFTIIKEKKLSNLDEIYNEEHINQKMREVIDFQNKINSLSSDSYREERERTFLRINSILKKYLFSNTFNRWIYYYINNLISYLNEHYSIRYKIKQKLVKKDRNFLITEYLMSDKFNTFYENSMRKTILYYEEMQEKFCKISLSQIEEQYKKLSKYIKKSPTLKKEYLNKRCFAIASNNKNEEVISFSGIFDSTDEIIDTYFLPFQKLAKAIDELLKTQRFVKSKLAKTEKNTKYYFSTSKNDFIKLEDVLKSLKPNDIKPEIKRMFSCCEKKILSKYPNNIKEIYVKLKPCELCVRAIDANNNPKIIHGINQKCSLEHLNAYDRLANDIFNGKIINISSYFK